MADRPMPSSLPRGRPRVKEPRTSTISIAVTPREHDELIRVATARRAPSLSDYGRRVLFLSLGISSTD